MPVAEGGRILIDDFSTPVYTDVPHTPTVIVPMRSEWEEPGEPHVDSPRVMQWPEQIASDNPFVLGNQRDVWLDMVDPNEPQTSSWAKVGSIDDPQQPGSGALTLASAHPGASLCVQYDGYDEEVNGEPLNDALDLGGLDLTGGGTNDRFELLFDFLDAGLVVDGQMHFEIVVQGNNGQWAFYEDDILESQDDPFVYEALFEDFEPQEGADLDALFQDVDSVTFHFNHSIDQQPTVAVLDVDFRLTQISAVPEPGTLVLLVGGLLVALSVRSGRCRVRR